jgi:hypothetical protein
MTEPATRRRLRLNPRIAGMIVLLIVFIAVSVIAADIVSRRDRNPVPPVEKLR